MGRLSLPRSASSNLPGMRNRGAGRRVGSPRGGARVAGAGALSSPRLPCKARALPIGLDGESDVALRTARMDEEDA
jgi:hypothetical protein